MNDAKITAFLPPTIAGFTPDFPRGGCKLTIPSSGRSHTLNLPLPYDNQTYNSVCILYFFHCTVTHCNVGICLCK